MKNVLAIRFARLGDIILLLPALDAIKSSLPGVRLTLLTGHRCADLATMSSAVDEVISVDRIAMRDGPVRHALRDVKQLVSDIRARQFDAAIDFHSFRETNLLTWFSRAPIRIGMKRHNESFLSFCFSEPGVPEDKSIHVAEMFRRVAGTLPGVNPQSSSGRPLLSVPGSIGKAPSAGLALYVDAPVSGRRWPAESFAAVADYAVEHWGASPLILAGPDGAPLIERVLQASRCAEKLRVFSALSLPELAAVIQSAELLISNDTGPMHLGPALGVRTLGLFSVGLTEHFRPIGPRDRFLKAMPIEGISVERVIAEAEPMFRKG